MSRNTGKYGINGHGRLSNKRIKGSALDFRHMDTLASCKMLLNTSRLSIIDSVAIGSKNVQSQGLTPWKKKEVLASKQ